MEILSSVTVVFHTYRLYFSRAKMPCLVRSFFCFSDEGPDLHEDKKLRREPDEGAPKSPSMSRIKAKLPTISEDDETAFSLLENSSKLQADSTDICLKRRPAADKKKGGDEGKNKRTAVVASEKSSGIATKVKEREERSDSWQPPLLQPTAQVTEPRHHQDRLV